MILSRSLLQPYQLLHCKAKFTLKLTEKQRYVKRSNLLPVCSQDLKIYQYRGDGVVSIQISNDEASSDVISRAGRLQRHQFIFKTGIDLMFEPDKLINCLNLNLNLYYFVYE